MTKSFASYNTPKKKTAFKIYELNIGDVISTGRGVVRGIRNISSLTAGVFASKIVSTLGTGAVTALSGGVLTVPGAVGAAVVGVAAGVAVSSLVDNGLATVEKWIFSSQE